MKKYTKNKVVCPTCGRALNKWPLPFTKDMIHSLFRVFRWCEQHRQYTFKKAQVRHLIDDVTQSTWHYLERFTLVTHEKRGYYRIDPQMLGEFFAGRHRIPVEVLKDMVTKEYITMKMGTIHDVPKITQFLDAEKDYIVVYQGKPTQPGQ